MSRSRDIVNAVVLLSSGGFAVEVIRGFFQKRKMGADYADVISASAVRLLKPLEDQIDDLQSRLRQTQKELTQTNRELTLCKVELRHAKEEAHELRTQMRKFQEQNNG
jgi:chromosome segregation ATPase